MKSKKIRSAIQILKEDDPKTFVESNYEHLGMTLGYAGFLAGFQFLGIDFSPNESNLQLSASFVLVFGFLLSIMSVTITMIYLGKLAAYRRESNEIFSNQEHRELLASDLGFLKFRNIPMILAVASTISWLLSINIGLHISWPNYLSFTLNGITVLGTIVIFSLNFSVGGTAMQYGTETEIQMTPSVKDV